MIPKTIHDLETPSVLIDLDRMSNNIQQMQKLCDDLGIGFRPHIKTHKIPDIALRQIEAGAIGIACQKVSEAEIFAWAGIHDIQLPYNILGERKTARLAELALTNRITVSADNSVVISGLAEAAKAKGATIRVLVDLVTDAERTGAPADKLVELAKQIDAAENLHFAGILLYPSNPVVRPELQRAMELLNKAGLDVEVVSGGGTGAVLHAHEMPELTEIRVGTYVFGDVTCVVRGWGKHEDCAMTVMATVVSRPTADRGILDSGSKTLAADQIDGGHGMIVEYPDARIYKLNEEHAYVDFSACADRPEIGEIVHVIPVHTCVVTNLHNRIFGVRGEDVEHIWEVAARGLVW